MNVSSFLRIFVSLSALSVSVAAHAAGISISPLKFEFEISAGKEQSGVVRVTNDTGKPITLYTSKEDFVAGDDSGTPTFVKPQKQTSEEFSLSNWITVEDKNLTLANGETREVRFVVKTPVNAEPGGHYGAVFFAPAAEKAQVAIVQRLGALVLVDVPGETKVSGKLDTFEAGYLTGGILQAKSSFNEFPVSFVTKFKNEGNVHLKPLGKVELVDENGEVLKNVGKEALLSPQGAYMGEKLVDYLPVNDGFGNVLPNSERRFDSVWSGFGYPIVNDDGSRGVNFRSLSEYYADKAAEKRRYLKFYEAVHSRTVSREITANLTLSYEAKDKSKKEFKDSKKVTVVYEEQYVGPDYAVVIVLLVLLSGLGYYAFVVVPRSREKIRKEMLESMRNSLTKKEGGEE